MATALTVEERLGVLEKEVAALRQRQPTSQAKPNWIEKITGSFKDDPDFEEILRLGQEFRKAERLEDVNGDA